MLLRADSPARDLADLANAVRWPVNVAGQNTRAEALLVAALAADAAAERRAFEALGADAPVFHGDNVDGLHAALVESARLVIA